MGKEHGLVKVRPAAGFRIDWAGDPGQAGEAFLHAASKGQRDKGWARGDDLMAELARQFISEAARADLRNGKPARRDDEIVGFKLAFAGLDGEPAVAVVHRLDTG